MLPAFVIHKVIRTLKCRAEETIWTSDVYNELAVNVRTAESMAVLINTDLNGHGWVAWLNRLGVIPLRMRSAESAARMEAYLGVPHGENAISARLTRLSRFRSGWQVAANKQVRYLADSQSPYHRFFTEQERRLIRETLR